MKAKKIWIVVGLLLVCTVAVCISSTLTHQQRALERLNALKVNVLISDGAPRGSLLESQIQTDVELKLRSYGLKVWGKGDVAHKASTLLIGLGAVPVHYENSSVSIGYAFFVLVQLDDHVKILRNNNLTFAATWQGSTVAFADTDRFEEHARRIVSDYIDEFLNDYLAANPKQQPKKEAES